MNDSARPISKPVPRVRPWLLAALALTVLLGGSAYALKGTGVIPRLRQRLATYLHQRAVQAAQDKDLSGQDLTQTKLKDAHLGASKLDHADMRKAQLSSATFIEADLRQALLDEANLSNANMLAADLTGASLNKAVLDGAWLTDSILREATLEGASLGGTRLQGADLSTARGLTQAQLANACGDDTTKLPAGLTVPACD